MPPAMRRPMRVGKKLARPTPDSPPAVSVLDTSDESAYVHLEDMTLLELDPASVAPNVMNPRRRMRNMAELDKDIAAHGQHTPGAVMLTAVFHEHYPHLAAPTHGLTWTVLTGHRRRLSCANVGKPFLALLRNDVARASQVENVLTSENKNRVDLTPLEEALMLDNYRQRKLNYRQIAEEAGYSPGTVSKYLSLLTLPEELQEALHERELRFRAAYEIAAALKDPERQTLAWHLMRDEQQPHTTAITSARLATLGGSPTPAAQQAVDTGTHEAAAVHSPTDPPKEPASLVPQPTSERTSPTPGPDKEIAPTPAASLIPQRTPTPEPVSEPDEQGSSPELSDEDARRNAAASRMRACERVIAGSDWGTPTQLAARLALAVVNPEAQKAAHAQAHAWLREAGHAKDVPTEAFPGAVLGSGDDKLTLRAAAAIALAISEARLDDDSDREWDDHDRTHLDLLVRRGGHQITLWEQTRLRPALTTGGGTA